MRKINDFIKDNFLSDSLRADSVILQKSIVIVYLHFFIIAICIFAYIFLFLGSPMNSEIPILFGTIVAMSSLWFFKKYSNLFLTSNFLSFSYFLVLAKSVPSTGGLYSDNLLWLVLTPLISLLFANKKSGFSALLLLLSFTIYTYYCEANDTKPTIVFHNDYFLTSYLFLFSSIFIVAIIFENGQLLIIKILNNQKLELEEQKLALEQKNQEILEQKQQLEIMGEKLKEINYALEHFAATAAHDLREPLRMIGMYTSMSQRRMNNYPDKIRDEYMGFVTNGVSRMNNLLTNLLEYSRSGRKEGDMKQVDLNNSLHNVILNLTVVLKETGACVITTSLPTIHASDTDMSQLFQNLIANAIKFRKVNVPSEVFISYINRKDTHVISIKDNGIGIKKEHQSKVFNIFERVNGRDKYDGSGIGLATCRKIVESLNGKIWLRSAEGEGTTFYIAFPKNQTRIMIKELELELV
jgi:signal transduction histidine kinase